MPWSVCVVIGAPVATDAFAAASKICRSYALICPGPVATLMMPALMPVEPMPSVSSRMNSSAIASTTGPKFVRKCQYAVPPSASL